MSALFAICFTVLFVYSECMLWGIFEKQDPACVSNCIVCSNKTCESRNYTPRYCPVLGTITSVSLVTQISQTLCKPITYSYVGNVLTVNSGCRGDFKVCYEECSSDVELVECESIKSQPTVCTAKESIYNVEVFMQYSHNECQPDVSYSYTGNQLTVTDGCRAKFILCVGSDWNGR